MRKPANQSGFTLLEIMIVVSIIVILLGLAINRMGNPTGFAKTVAVKTEQVGKRLSGKLNKFKKSVADKVPKVMNAAIKEKGPEWQLNEEDSSLLAEAVENCFEILDVDFQITPISKILTNPLWVLILPAFVLVLIFIPKMVANAGKEKEEEETSGGTVTT